MLEKYGLELVVDADNNIENGNKTNNNGTKRLERLERRIISTRGTCIYYD